MTLGVYDLSKDQIDLKYLKNIPSVFLFTPYEEAPIEYQNRFEFEYVLKFIKQETQKSKDAEALKNIKKA